MSESFSLPIASIAQIPPQADPLVEGMDVPPSDFTIEEVELAPLPEEDPSAGLAANALMPPDPLQMLIEGLSGITAALDRTIPVGGAQAAFATPPQAGAALPGREIVSTPMIEAAPAPTFRGDSAADFEDTAAEAPAAPDPVLGPAPPEASPPMLGQPTPRMALTAEATPATEVAGPESDGSGQPQAALLPLLGKLAAHSTGVTTPEPTTSSALTIDKIALPWPEPPIRRLTWATPAQTAKTGRRDDGIGVALADEDPGRIRVEMTGIDQSLPGDPARELAGAVTPDLAAPLTGAPRDVASAAPQPPLHRVPMAAVARQIADAVVTAREDRIEITLAPEELGRIRMVMSGPEHSPHVLIWAERPEVLDQLRRNTAFLQECLGDAGMAEASVDFQDNGGSRDGAGDRRALPDAPAPATEPADIVHRSVAWTSLALPARLDIRI